MIQIRDVLQSRFGKTDQAVELFKRLPQLAPTTAPDIRFNVLTDISGPMYTIVSEQVAADFDAWEKLRAQVNALPNFDQWFKDFQLFIEGGRREYYTVEGAYDNWSRPGVIVVREVYRAYKWQIRPAVTLLQRYGALLADRGVGQRPRILTDASGPMFQAVIEIETESMQAWETHRRSLFREPEFKVWFVQLCNVAEAGAHEFFRVEHTSER
ncbi:MAG: hypothetical protein HY259_10530 [Chloroflexi bacterium]|nr:hypothetical protein [Chloroflexota bacterium]MBI3733874.1 hypothetical protein [Chloroflexota bacterium]